jgi:hypothetical protein
MLVAITVAAFSLGAVRLDPPRPSYLERGIALRPNGT